jgi:hypothetical protein
MAWLDSHGLVVKKGKMLAIPSMSRIRALIEESWND